MTISFQIDAETLGVFANDIASLYERPRLRVLARVDRFDRFVSVLAFLPKDRYDTQARRRIGDYLARVFRGRLSAAFPFYPEGPLVRTHFIIGRNEDETPKIPREQLESDIAGIIRTWPDAMRDALAQATPRRRTMLRHRRAPRVTLRPFRLPIWKRSAPKPQSPTLPSSTA